MNLEVQTSWQAQHFVNLEVQISWQAQHFVKRQARTSLHAQHFVNLETFLWQALHFFEPQSADYTSELTRERMKQCEDHSWSKEARGKGKACLFPRRLVHITLDRWFEAQLSSRRRVRDQKTTKRKSFNGDQKDLKRESNIYSSPLRMVGVEHRLKSLQQKHIGPGRHKRTKG